MTFNNELMSLDLLQMTGKVVRVKIFRELHKCASEAMLHNRKKSTSVHSFPPQVNCRHLAMERLSLASISSPAFPQRKYHNRWTPMEK